jgi:hypothetical protein
LQGKKSQIFRASAAKNADASLACSLIWQGSRPFERYFFHFFVCSSKFLNLAGTQLNLAAVSAEQLSELLHGIAALMQRTGHEILRVPTF